MRLGEFRTHLRRFDDKLTVKLSVYELLDSGIYDLEIDIVNDNCVYLRPVGEKKEK